MTNIDNILQSRDITLLKKVHLVKVMVFPTVICRCESGTLGKAEHWKTDASEQWCWRKFLRVLWTAGRSNQSILKEINPEYSLEGLMLKLKSNALATWCKSQYPGKDPKAGKDWRQKEKRVAEDEMVRQCHWLSGHEFEQTPEDTEGQGSLACWSPRGRKE